MTLLKLTFTLTIRANVPLMLLCGGALINLTCYLSLWFPHWRWETEVKVFWISYYASKSKDLDIGLHYPLSEFFFFFFLCIVAFTNLFLLAPGVTKITRLVCELSVYFLFDKYYYLRNSRWAFFFTDLQGCWKLAMVLTPGGNWYDFRTCLYSKVESYVR